MDVDKMDSPIKYIKELKNELQTLPHRNKKALENFQMRIKLIIKKSLDNDPDLLEKLKKTIKLFFLIGLNPRWEFPPS